VPVLRVGRPVDRRELRTEPMAAPPVPPSVLEQADAG
jgi:hypothetical protein